MQREDRADESAEIRADVPDDGALESLEERWYPSRRVDHQPARWREHPAHFGDSADSVLHEHQSHLAQHDIDGGVRYRQRGGIGYLPVDVGPARNWNRLRDLDHVGCDVDSDDSSRAANPFGGSTGDVASAACDVDDAFARRQSGREQQVLRHRCGDQRHEIALIVLGRPAGEMAVRDGRHAWPL